MYFIKNMRFKSFGSTENWGSNSKNVSTAGWEGHESWIWAHRFQTKPFGHVVGGRKPAIFDGFQPGGERDSKFAGRCLA